MTWTDVTMADGTRGYQRPHAVTWLDPGATTGWARYITSSSSFQSGQLDFTDMCTQLNSWLHDEADMSWLGWESFQIRPGSGRMNQDGSSLQVIGVARWLAHVHGALIVKPQNPDARLLGAKSLRRAGWNAPGKIHANDAAAHLLAFTLKMHVATPEVLAAVAAGMV